MLALTLTTSVQTSFAQSTNIQRPFDLGLKFTQKEPYNFTGRLFGLTDGAVGFGSGTLLRRHTVLTAGHVIYDPTVGFTTAATFTRALYEDYNLQKQAVSKVAALAGYQVAVDTQGNTSNAAFAQDQGYILTTGAPVDESWANFVAEPALLTNPTTQFVVLGYPGVTFDGRRMAYIVPKSPFVQVNGTGSYTNENYVAEEGMSGGPIYVVLGGGTGDPNQRYVAADTVGGIDDSTGEFNVSFVRAIDKSASRFLIDAEYSAGLIQRVKITGPAAAARGTTIVYTAKPVFRLPDINGNKKITTDRYSEIKLMPTNAQIRGQEGVTIKKTSNTTFAVTFSNSTALRSGSVITLQAYYNKMVIPAGKSTFSVKIQ